MGYTQKCLFNISFHVHKLKRKKFFSAKKLNHWLKKIVGKVKVLAQKPGPEFDPPEHIKTEEINQLHIHAQTHILCTHTHTTIS